jgi:hypothetical protein
MIHLRLNFLNQAITFRWVMIAIIILLGCEEETIVKDNKGEIIGFVTLLDENGIEIQDKSNVKITLDEKHSVTTNAIGRFEFKDIEAGTYQVLFEKEGFGSVKRFNYIFTAGNVPGVITDVNMIGLSTISLIDKQIQTSSSSITVTGTMTGTNSYYFVYYFYDKENADVSDYITSAGYSFCCSPVTTFTHNLSIPPSSPLYVACYAMSKANEYGQYNYYDYEKARSVNAALKELFGPVRIR